MEQVGQRGKVIQGISRHRTNGGGEYWARIGFCGDDRLQFIDAEAERLSLRPTVVMRLLLQEIIDMKLKAGK